MHCTKLFIEAPGSSTRGGSKCPLAVISVLPCKALQEFSKSDMQQPTEVILVRKKYPKTVTLSVFKSLFLVREEKQSHLELFTLIHIRTTLTTYLAVTYRLTKTPEKASSSMLFIHGYQPVSAMMLVLFPSSRNRMIYLAICCLSCIASYHLGSDCLEVPLSGTDGPNANKLYSQRKTKK